MSEEFAAEEPRRLSVWLILGILVLPVVFSWFTLRRGYSPAVRVGAFLYLALAIGIAIVRSGAERPPAAEVVAREFLESPQPPAPTPELAEQLKFLDECTAARIRASDISYEDSQDEVTAKVQGFMKLCSHENGTRLQPK